ncbi:MAG: carboxylating nicotinate-nucleotide diphosphorylase [Chitinophagales bacterium]
MLSHAEQFSILANTAFQEDIGSGDHSALAAIPADARGKAILLIKEDGILAGLDAARSIFHMREPGAVFKAMKMDGDAMKSGEIAFEISATIHAILACERLVLNCMQRMSGIATLTRTYVNKLKGYNTRILDTRKTTPNFRLLEKEAVRIGGGLNHRFGLYDMIMLKDNHIDYCGSIELAIEKAYLYNYGLSSPLKIEIETRSLADVKKVLAIGRIDRIMLDNFSIPDLKNAIQLIDGKYETEASGGINLDNVEEYASTRVDFVSIGALIHQARSLDLSLKAMDG